MLKDEITRQHPDYKTVVLCKTLGGSVFRKLGYCFHMLRQMYNMATSEIAILDSYSILISLLNHKPSLTVIQIWHSVGTMKKFGYSILDKPEGSSSKIAREMNMHRNYDYILCAGEGYRAHLAEGFNYPEEKIVILPLPRVEFLKNSSTIELLRKKIIKTYPELGNKRNILYVPTFRKDDDEAIAFDKAFKVLKEAFTPYENDYNFIAKTHPLANLDSLYPEYSSFEMLAIADYVISDYSCIIYEAAILQKPIYFYTFDFETYISKRDIYMDYKREIPGEMYSNPSDLINALTTDVYDKDRLDAFLKKYVEYERVDITKNIVEFIWAHKKR